MMEADYHKALKQIETGDLSGALQGLDRILKKNPKFAPAYRPRAQVREQLQDLPGAIADYKEAMRLQPTAMSFGERVSIQSQIIDLENAIVQARLLNSAKHLSSPLFFSEARAKVDRGEYSEALSDLDLVLQMQPDRPEALCQRAKVHAKLGNPKAAVEDIARALQLEPENRELRWHRGVVRLSVGDGAGAVLDFTHLMQFEGDRDRLFLQRGHGYCLLGDLDKAFKDYCNAIAMSDRDAEAFASRAGVAEALGDVAGAIADFQQAAALWLNQGNWEAHKQAIAQAKKAAESSIIRVPIKARWGGVPIVEVVLNNGCAFTFELLLDTGASRTQITQRMADLLKIVPCGTCQSMIADGSVVTFDLGWVQSLAVQTAVVRNIQISIGDNRLTYGLLGQDFMARYNVQILENQVEFKPR
ncbi:tetratricopeptide repeat protein [Microcoleus sp. A006_D1]|uniref:tetratricopeptide repeat protein n=1 Tax=Microcoleus sp. A006_D1 TaxID=3055267 RepID=UPI002FD4A99E